MFIPFQNHSIGIEYKPNKYLGIQAVLQHHWEMPLGEVEYHNIRFFPSIRLYIPAKRKLFSNFYASSFLRFARIIQIFEGPDFDFRDNTVSAGFLFGRQLLLNKGAAKLDFGIGLFRILTDNEWNDYSQHSIFHYRKNWRVNYELLLSIPIKGRN